MSQCFLYCHTLHPLFPLWPCCYRFKGVFVAVARQLELDLVPRIQSEQVDVEHVSAVELYRLHEDSVEKSQKQPVRIPIPVQWCGHWSLDFKPIGPSKLGLTWQELVVLNKGSMCTKSIPWAKEVVL